MKSETSERLDRLMARLFALGVVVLSHEAVGHAKEVALVKEKIRDVCRSAIEENERRLREATIEECAKVADAHKGAAAKERRRKGFKQTDEIQAEERGEDIASEIIAREIRALMD